jgi:hypothetical protein
MSDDMTEREYERMLDTFNTASEWHSGQWSALYSYASTGKIWGEEHKADLLAEIETCLCQARSISPRNGGFLSRGTMAALEHLRYTVECWPDEAI